MSRRLFMVIALLSFLTGADAVADGRVPAYVLELPDSVTDVFVAETGTATIYRFENTPAGLALGDQYYMSIGENGAGKQRAWDRKTPLGIYFVIDQLDTSRLHEKYGVTAFPLDYPNAWDRRQQRTGDGIWVHGVLADGPRRPPRDTDGCLALPNESLLALEKKFIPLQTPVVITRSIAWQTPAVREALRTELNVAIRRWTDALAAADVHAYLSTYSDEFRFNGLTFDDWASLRARVLDRRGKATVVIDDLMLLADAEEDGLLLSRFRQTVADSDVTTVTTKRLYWRRGTEGALKIVAEDNG